MNCRILHVSLVLCALMATSAVAADTGRFRTREKPDADVEYLIYLAADRPVIFKLHLRINGKNFRDVWTQQIDKFFKELDTNRDGVLTGKEINAIPSSRDLNISQLIGDTQPRRRLPTIRRNAADTDPSDGKITRKELRAYLMSIGVKPFTVQSTTGNQPSRVVTYGMNNSGDTAGKRLFLRLDRNNDGKLSLAELKVAAKSLRKSDLDDDETISDSELTPVQSPYAFATSSRSMRPTNRSEFLSIASGESRMQMVGKLIQRYDRPESRATILPTNKKARKPAPRGDRKLSPRELQIDKRLFSKFDADRDGYLDFTELRIFLRKPAANIELVLRLGKRERDQKLVKVLRVDPGLKSALKRVTGQLAHLRLRAAMLDIGSSDTQAWGEFSTVNYESQFKSADADNNGYLTKDEARRTGFFYRPFDQMDADRDGKVFKKEMLAYYRRQSSLASSRTILNVSDQGRDLFKILDLNRDRRLSRTEIAAAVDRIDAWDTDNDKQIAFAEIPRQYRLSVARGRPGNAFSAPLAVRANPYGRNIPAQTGTGPKWFLRMDLNRDGELSRREFLGTPQQFGKLDADRNGYINAAEAAKTKK